MEKNKFVMNKYNNIDPSEISFCIALIPKNPIFTQISEASLKITQLFDNENIIDNDVYPTHVSLYLGGCNTSQIESVWKILSEKVSDISIVGRVDRIYSGSYGFMGASVDGENITKSHEIILGIMEEELKKCMSIRPHLLKRFRRLSKAQQTALMRYGSYHIAGYFRPHFSIAQIDEEDVSAALKISKGVIQIPQDVVFDAVQMIDVGHNNMDWKVLNTLPL